MQPIKRKFEEVEDPRMTPFMEEPQSILNMSMCKLRMPPIRREPSLRRSVLIFNTLRHIERELKRQGVTLPQAPSPGLWQPEDMAMDTLDPPPGAEVPPVPPVAEPPPPMTPLPPSSYYSGPSMMCSDFHNYNASYTEYSETPREAEHLDTDSSGESSDDSNDDFPDSPGAPSPPCPPQSSNTPPTSFYLDLDCPSNTTTWSDLSSSTQGQGQQTSFLVNSLSTGSPKWSCSSAPTFTTLQTFSSFSAGNLTSNVSNSSQQDTFGDIDISMYDFDLATISPTMKQLTPVTTEDLLLSIPSDSASFKSDLLGDDLDHIMQILIGI